MSAEEPDLAGHGRLLSATVARPGGWDRTPRPPPFTAAAVRIMEGLRDVQALSFSTYFPFLDLPVRSLSSVSWNIWSK